MTCFQSVRNDSDYGRVEVPMHIVPSPKISSACLQSLARLPGILTMEEEEAYQRYKSRIIGKPAFCICENKDADLSASR